MKGIAAGNQGGHADISEWVFFLGLPVELLVNCYVFVVTVFCGGFGGLGGVTVV